MAFAALPHYLDVAVVPILRWPGSPTPSGQRTGSAFRASLATTYRDLARELDALDAREATLHVPVPPEHFRRDGRPRADARVNGPGIVLTFTADGREYEYAADRFVSWQENLRAIALTLEALRRVDRYGLSDKRQYAGFVAIEAPKPAPADDGSGVDRAIVTLRRIAGLATTEQTPPLTVLLRRAQAKAHPDRGGSSELWFQTVQAAERLGL